MLRFLLKFIVIILPRIVYDKVQVTTTFSTIPIINIIIFIVSAAAKSFPADGKPVQTWLLGK